MKKKVLILVAALMTSMFILTACGNSGGLVGVWEFSSGPGWYNSIEFNRNGEIFVTDSWGGLVSNPTPSAIGTWEVSDSRLIWTWLDGTVEIYAFEIINNSTLRITSPWGSTRTYVRTSN